MRARVYTVLTSASLMAAAMAVAQVAVPPRDAHNCVAREASPDTLSPTEFAMKMSLLDFLVVQRALMTMQDERAAPVLQRLRAQFSGQEQPLHGPDP
jgi:hypothetical protein